MLASRTARNSVTGVGSLQGSVARYACGTQWRARAPAGGSWGPPAKGPGQLPPILRGSWVMEAAAAAAGKDGIWDEALRITSLPSHRGTLVRVELLRFLPG